MPRKQRRVMDHDYSTRLYIAQIEATYDGDIEVAFKGGAGSLDTGRMVAEIFFTPREEAFEADGELMAKGDVSTASNAQFNQNLRYLLTVAMLRIMEQHLDKS